MGGVQAEAPDAMPVPPTPQQTDQAQQAVADGQELLIENLYLRVDRETIQAEQAQTNDAIDTLESSGSPAGQVCPLQSLFHINSTV